MKQAKLIISDSEKDSNMLYAAGIVVPDDFIYLEKNGKKTVYVDSLEFNRAKKEAKADKVANYLNYDKKADKNNLGEVLIKILNKEKVKKVLVPDNFKIKYAKILNSNKINIEVKNPFFEKRAVKNRAEIANIAVVQKVNEEALEKSVGIIKKSRIRKDKKLVYQNKILTSEFIKEILNIEFLKGNCGADINIVSSSRDTADPHRLGKGPLMADQPIIIDIFPRSQVNRYFSDMTRTIVKGKASPEIKKIYQAVLKAQKMAISRVKSGAKGKEIHKLVEDYFAAKGFKTEKQGKNIQGFIHGTGHGVGLDMHELPFINANSDNILQEGNIVTIEPGLYYPKVGGVRIEDIVLVTKTGCKNLTKFPKFLEV